MSWRNIRYTFSLEYQVITSLFKTMFCCILCYVLCTLFTLQPDDDTPPSHITFNILCHAARVKPEKARITMEHWVDKHIDYVQQVTKPFLENICLSFQKFKDQWLHPMFPLNSAGILIMSRAYKLHTAVFFNDKFWTTSSDISALHKCSVFLIYRGGTVFQDTRRMHVEEYEEQKAMIRNMGKYYEKWKMPSKEYRSKLCNCIPSDDEDNDIEQVTSESRTDLLTNIMPTDDEDEVPSTSVSRESPPCSECDKQKKRRKSVTDCKKCSKCQFKESNCRGIVMPRFINIHEHP